MVRNTMSRLRTILVLSSLFLVACQSNDAAEMRDENSVDSEGPVDALGQGTVEVGSEKAFQENAGISSGLPATIADHVSWYDLVLELEITEIGDARWNTLSGELPENWMREVRNENNEPMFHQYKPVVMRIVESHKPSNVDSQQHYILLDVSDELGEYPPSPFGSSRFGNVGDHGFLFANQLESTQPINPIADAFSSVGIDMAEERTNNGSPHEVIIEKTWFLFSGNDAIDVFDDEGSSLPIADLRQQVSDALRQ